MTDQSTPEYKVIPRAKVKLDDGGWFWEPNDIYKIGLSAVAVTIHGYIASHADKNGFAHPSIHIMTERLRIGNRRTTRKAIAELMAARLLKITTRNRKAYVFEVFVPVSVQEVKRSEPRKRGRPTRPRGSLGSANPQIEDGVGSDNPQRVGSTNPQVGSTNPQTEVNLGSTNPSNKTLRKDVASTLTLEEREARERETPHQPGEAPDPWEEIEVDGRIWYQPLATEEGRAFGMEMLFEYLGLPASKVERDRVRLRLDDGASYRDLAEILTWGRAEKAFGSRFHTAHVTKVAWGDEWASNLEQARQDITPEHGDPHLPTYGLNVVTSREEAENATARLDAKIEWEQHRPKEDS